MLDIRRNQQILLATVSRPGLAVAPDVVFPPNAATSTFAFLGKRGSGKTYSAGVLVEELLRASVQVVVVDPVGTWFGLRIAANGKGVGFSLPVFGGQHGDVPLASTGGELVARLVVEQRMSCVLDVSDFTAGDQRRFVTDLSREVFQLKKVSRSPLHIVFEEGHEFFPQFVDAAAAPMVGATTRLWKVGRNYGIGGSIVSQRTAEVNKSALWLTDRIITGRLTASDDIKRIDGWANSNSVSNEMVKELPKLPPGTMIVWEETGAVRTRFRAKTTLDTSKTPDADDPRVATKLPAIDLDEVRVAMSASIEAAQASDPKTLKARIAALERELAKKPITKAEKPALRESDLKRVERLAERLQKASVALDDSFKTQRDLLGQARDAVVIELGKLTGMLRSALVPAGVVTNGVHQNGTFVQTERRPIVSPTMGADNRLPEKSQRMLGALRQAEALGKPSMPFSAIAVIAGVAPTSGTTRNRKGQLVGEGYIVVQGDQAQLTDKGRAYPINVALPPPDPAELLDFWRHEIGTVKVGAILTAVVGSGQSGISDADLASAAGMEPSGTYRNYKGELTRRGLIHKRGDMYVPDEVFL